MPNTLSGHLLAVALLALSMSGCGTDTKVDPTDAKGIPTDATVNPTDAKGIPFVLNAPSGTPTMKLGTLTFQFQFAELKLKRPHPEPLYSHELISGWGGVFEGSDSDGFQVKGAVDYKQSGSSGVFTLKFEKPAQKEFVFEIVNDSTDVRYSDKTYSLKDSLTLVIDSDGVRMNSKE